MIVEQPGGYQYTADGNQGQSEVLMYLLWASPQTFFWAHGTCSDGCRSVSSVVGFLSSVILR